MGDGADRDRAFKQCAACPVLLAEFQAEITLGQAAARGAAANADNDNARFFLGKIDLNYVWMQLATLGNCTRWDPGHGSAQGHGSHHQAPADAHPRPRRAGVDRLHRRHPRDLGLPLGAGRWQQETRAGLDARGGQRRHGHHFTDRSEVGLWEMLVREKQFAEAKTIAKALATEFPENKELAIFIKTHGG